MKTSGGFQAGQACTFYNMFSTKGKRGLSLLWGQLALLNSCQVIVPVGSRSQLFSLASKNDGISLGT
jgi:hypothetical protein